MQQLQEGDVSEFMRLGREAVEEHDTLYIDMLKENIDREALRCSSSVRESDDEVKRRLDTACTLLMQAIFDKHFQNRN